MAKTETEAQAAAVSTENSEWVGGVVAGLAGGLLMGVMLSMRMTGVMEVAIPSLYGLSGGLAGWVIHMSHSAVLGVVFAALLSVPAIGKYADGVGKTAALGLVYGIVLWVVLAAIVMPIWLSAVGSPAQPPLPNFNPQSLIGHLVYGVVLSAVFPYVRNL
jgi:uncharacterized membrane protein YagU involved in acid resistance